MTQQPTPAVKQHIQGLDGLRGFAVICVLLFHLFPYTIKGGYNGVSVFFLLSGYLLMAIGVRDWKQGRFNVLKFYGKRVKRIYPTLILIVFMTAGIMQLMMPQQLGGMRPEIASIFGGYNNLWQIAQNSSYFTRISNASPFTHIWTLGIELQYYLVWPILFLAYAVLRKASGANRAMWLFPVLAAVSIVIMEVKFHPGQDVTPIYYGTFTRVFSFFFGAFVACLVEQQQNRSAKLATANPEPWLTVVFVVLFLAQVPMIIFMDGQSAFTYRFGMILYNLVTCVLLYIAVNPDYPFGKWLDNRAFNFLGKYSYEIYLWQYPLIFISQKEHWMQYWYTPVLIILLTLALSVWTQLFTRTLINLPKSRKKAKSASHE